MKTMIVILIASSVALVASASAQERKGERSERSERPTAEKLIEKFDKDGDGALDAEEIRAAFGERRGKMQERRKDFMEKYDTDGDGQLSEAEKAALPDEVRERIASMRDRFGNREKGSRREGGNPSE